ncbi:hypothetical protein LCGC14_2863660, partial [marine sediment metagenome]
MANPNRGEVAFTALGREMFVQYGTREIAEAQAALGFHRPDPQQPNVAEDVDVPVYADAAQEKPKLDGRQRPVFRRQRVLIDAREQKLARILLGGLSIGNFIDITSRAAVTTAKGAALAAAVPGGLISHRRREDRLHTIEVPSHLCVRGESAVGRSFRPGAS